MSVTNSDILPEIQSVIWNGPLVETPKISLKCPGNMLIKRENLNSQ